ncbi:MAG: PQQ-like beta-propeller repeat protein [Myxococcales bacterium]|nr:PQQ-like beta-propeller repeat protein [Myxococcales bacterium]
MTPPTATVALAPHVGAYVAAAHVEGGALLAVVLSAGARGEHRALVLDTRTWAVVASFPVPNRAKSGVTPIDGEGELLFTNDDHSITALHARTGARVWERAFPSPASVRMFDVAGGRVLVSVFGEGPIGETRFLRAADGADEATIAECIVPSVQAPALAKDGTIALAGMRVVDVVRVGQPTRRIDHAMKRWGAVDCAAFDDDGRRVVFGTRAGEVCVTDLGDGTTRTVLEADGAIRSVGFLRGAPWSLDDAGRLRVLGAEAPRLAVDLAVGTYGGILSEDGATLSLGDYAARSFRVRAIPSNEELFATNPGFSCNSVGIDAEGALLVSSDDRLVRIDPATGRCTKLGGGVRDVTRTASGALVLCGASVRLLAPGVSKAAPLARSADEVNVVRELVCATAGQVAEIWDARTATRAFRVDLAKTWVADTGEALRLVHLGPDGAPWVHLTDGAIFRGDAIAADDALVGRLSPDGTLWVHPDGASLYWARGRTISRVAIDGLTEGPPLPLAHDAEVGGLVFSPSGERLVVFHRDGRLSCVDLGAGRAVAIDAPETSAAERAPNEVFVIDLRTPRSAAFSVDETVVAWTDAGGVTFADLVSGARVGRFLLASSGRDWLATDGVSFDGSGAKAKKPVSSELVAIEAGRVLDHTAVLGRRQAGVLARLTRAPGSPPGPVGR